MKKVIFIVFITIIFIPSSLRASSLTERLSGQILLQVEDNGEAWYVNPDNSERYYMGRPQDAYNLMRQLGLGIKHGELEKYLNTEFPSRLSGRIMLDVEASGEAYYVYPADKQGYYLGRPDDAFFVMRNLGLGITNKDLLAIKETWDEIGIKKDKSTNDEEEEAPEQKYSTLVGLANELESFSSSGNVAGPEHYARMKADIKTIESYGADVSWHKSKLLNIKNNEYVYYNGCPTEESQAGPCGIEGELDYILGQGYPIDALRWVRLEADLLEYEDLGVDISGLREKLDIVLALEVPVSEEIATSSSPSPIANTALDLPVCESHQFTTPAIDLEYIDRIIPLGNFNPPEHSLPTRHMYYHTTWDELMAERNTAGLNAPGDIYITKVSYIYTSPLADREYVMEFALCESVGGYFGHIKSLSREIISKLDQAECDDWQNNAEHLCYKEINYFVPAGTVLGTIGGGLYGGFDFGLYDMREKLEFANPDRDRGLDKHMVCHLDYYEESTQSALYDKLDRIGQPACGEINQDIPGTLQGSWFAGFDHENVGTVGHLTFGQNNIDTSESIIAIGGNFTDAGSWVFDAKIYGFRNRDFTDITANGNTYCFRSEPKNIEDVEIPPGQINVEMIEDDVIIIEHQDTGPCTGENLFKDFYYYFR